MVSTGIKYSCIICVLFINFSCIREAYNITGKAIIVDNETLNPISESSVQSECIFQLNIDESSSDFSNCKTDSLGTFELNFSKGYKVSMVIDAEEYVQNTIVFNPRKEAMPDTIYLKRKISFETSAASINPEEVQENNFK